IRRGCPPGQWSRGACRCGRSRMRTLFLNPPSYDDFDGGAGARYQAKREVWSFWYPTWLSYPAGMLPGARLLDAPPLHMPVDEVVRAARDDAQGVPHTSTPSSRPLVKTARALKVSRPTPVSGSESFRALAVLTSARNDSKPDTVVGFV